MTTPGRVANPSASPSAWALSVIGGTHVGRGKPCQDHADVRTGEGWQVAAVADGHGDERHYRSDVGARLAVEVALDLFGALGQDLVKEGRWASPNELARLARFHLAQRVAWEWNTRIRAHWAADPGPTPTPPPPDTPEGTLPWFARAYGTTLLVVLVAEERVLYWQLGDGGIAVVPTEGNPEVVFPESEELMGKATWSLASTDIGSLVQVRADNLSAQALRLVALYTDGLSDSLDGDPQRCAAFVRHTADRVRSEGWDAVVQALPTTLERAARDGVGDDVSLALLEGWVRPAPQDALPTQADE